MTIRLIIKTLIDAGYTTKITSPTPTTNTDIDIGNGVRISGDGRGCIVMEALPDGTYLCSPEFTSVTEVMDYLMQNKPAEEEREE